MHNAAGQHLDIAVVCEHDCISQIKYISARNPFMTQQFVYVCGLLLTPVSRTRRCNLLNSLN